MQVVARVQDFMTTLQGVTCSRLSDMEGLGSLGELCPKMNKAKRNKKGLPIVELLLSRDGLGRPPPQHGFAHC
ncbi:hypothetical protein FOZ62_005594 [Perkinsus olseni]|uniref:Uncharacterized protein n=1 Tax=Perkinsus olseni TaxID=32597 RepID=A0A7J6QPK8_PEROL|nr:hypothetical protein FOZ62_005594 [Perkinsus olseni]